MQVETEMLPGVVKIIEDCENQLALFTGKNIKVRLEIQEGIVQDKRINLLRIAVCTCAKISWAQICGPSRKVEICDARFIYWYLSIKHLKRGVVELAKESNRNHASVINGNKAVKDRIKTNEAKTITMVRNIEEIIKHL